MTSAAADKSNLGMPTDQDAVFLKVRGLIKDYPGVRAVDHVSLGICPGEVVGLVGKNGAGKSTVIRILAGATIPDDGQILLDGEQIHLHNPHDATLLGLSFVHQELSVVPDLSVAENVELGLGYPRRAGVLVDFRKLRRQSREVLARLGGGIPPHVAIRTLPTAQQRLVMIARALVTQARLVVLDEPTGSLTDEETNHLFAVIRDLSATGVAVIYVSHRLEEILRITDRVVVMRDGTVVDDRPTEDFDTKTLIEEITGEDASATALQRRESRGIGGPPDASTVMEVEAIEVPGKIHHASFSIRSGEILGVAGLMGAGRTELVRAVFGADHRTGGQIRLHGVEADIRRPADAIAAGVVLLPEDRRNQGLIQDFNVRRNITLGTLSDFRITKKLPVPSVLMERQAAQSAVRNLDIKTPSDLTPATSLSGGNQQKLVLARWLRSGASVLIFDEPTHGIDVGAKEEIYTLMEELAASGKAVVFISSEFGELVGVCHRVIVMREGEIVGEVAGDEITENRLLEYCYGHTSSHGTSPDESICE